SIKPLDYPLGYNSLGCDGRRRQHRWQGHLLRDPLPFHNRVDEVCRNIFEGLGLAIGPANGDFVHLLALLQSEVLAKIILRDVARPAFDLAELSDLSGTHCHTSANRKPVAFGAEESKQHAMITVLAVIQQERWGFADVERNDIDAAIVIDIANCCHAP